MSNEGEEKNEGKGSKVDKVRVKRRYRKKVINRIGVTI